MRIHRDRCLFLIVSFLLVGCGANTPPVVPVSGTVSYRGQPLPGGVVVFTPDSAKGSNGPVATATIQSDGSFALHTGDAPGAAAGWHRITVVAVSDAGEEATGLKFTVPVSLIPERYRSPDLSGLSREVRAGDKNEIVLNLD